VNENEMLGSNDRGGFNKACMTGDKILAAELAVSLGRYLEHLVLDQNGPEISFDFKYQISDANPNRT
jgi:hypothetical protein